MLRRIVLQEKVGNDINGIFVNLISKNVKVSKQLNEYTVQLIALMQGINQQEPISFSTILRGRDFWVQDALRAYYI